MAKASKGTAKNPIARFFGYLRGVWAEFQRVVWPTRSEVLNSSLVVIATLVFFIFFTFVVDQAVTAAVRFVAGIGG